MPVLNGSAAGRVITRYKTYTSYNVLHLVIRIFVTVITNEDLNKNTWWASGFGNGRRTRYSSSDSGGNGRTRSKSDCDRPHAPAGNREQDRSHGIRVST